MATEIGGTYCPKCHAETVMRFGKCGAFLGCRHYPECDGVIALNNNDGHIVTHLGIDCPECGQERVLRKGRYGMFIGCLGYPECQCVESPEKKAETLSIPCPECHGYLVARLSRFGKTFYACDQYPKCRFVVNFPPVVGLCEKCNFRLLVGRDRAAGQYYQCANRRCQHEQPSIEKAS